MTLDASVFLPVSFQDMSTRMIEYAMRVSLSIDYSCGLLTFSLILAGIVVDQGIWMFGFRPARAQGKNPFWVESAGLDSRLLKRFEKLV